MVGRFCFQSGIFLESKKVEGAEEQVKNIFIAQGWSANDVSRQNLGYDIECVDKEGRKILLKSS